MCASLFVLYLSHTGRKCDRMYTARWLQQEKSRRALLVHWDTGYPVLCAICMLYYS